MRRRKAPARYVRPPGKLPDGHPPPDRRANARAPLNSIVLLRVSRLATGAAGGKMRTASLHKDRLSALGTSSRPPPNAWHPVEQHEGFECQLHTRG